MFNIYTCGNLMLSVQIHYLSFLLLVLRITSRGSPDEDIALSPILPQSGDVDAPVQDPTTGVATTDLGAQNGETLAAGSQAPENQFGKPSVTKPRTHGLITHSSHCQTSEPDGNSPEAGKNPAHVQPAMARTSSSSPNRHGAGQWTNEPPLSTVPSSSRGYSALHSSCIFIFIPWKGYYPSTMPINFLLRRFRGIHLFIHSHCLVVSHTKLIFSSHPFDSCFEMSCSLLNIPEIGCRTYMIDETRNCHTRLRGGGNSPTVRLANVIKGFSDRQLIGYQQASG
ncbi:uncharacterized protein EI90DRAFT_60283 [Cantharellus anzutake]|uniref:uncharacterized protein n=1 Tax=Cantharellus anzutake TaxID=1750568 RepID=UPI0019052C01|nr:uncharacterized protein EI90DRAFT_60283 [Cantharellus anzutake]KAF8344235.1 hypothetical protein EI90DRAFT_60283 [Cantharellus anzutake]